MLRISFVISWFFLLGVVFAPLSYASDWYYTMDNYQKRATVKLFAQLINEEFYKGKEKLFPFNRFYGYHAAVDLEYLTGEKDKDVPVYAVTGGTISYIGSLPGYGGVILQKLDGTNDTALYGHVKITDIPVSIGSKITSEKPTTITYLGDEFSNETSKERKHLHFGIYKGQDNYFRGHEKNLKVIQDKWYNPTNYLKEKGAVSPTAINSTSRPTPIPTTVEKRPNFVYNFWEWLISLFNK